SARMPTETDLRLLDEYRRSFGPVRKCRVRDSKSPRSRTQRPTGQVDDLSDREAATRKHPAFAGSGHRWLQGSRSRPGRSGHGGTRHHRAAFRGYPGRSQNVSEPRVPGDPHRGKPGPTTRHVQVRTAVQHSWAEFSEKLADLFDPALKYGGGRTSLRNLLEA